MAAFATNAAHVISVYIVNMTTPTPLERPISVRRPENLDERVEALAKAAHPSRGDIVSEVLGRDLSELEWEQRIIARAADLRSGKRRAFIWHFTGKHLMLEAGEGSR